MALQVDHPARHVRRGQDAAVAAAAPGAVVPLSRATTASARATWTSRSSTTSSSRRWRCPSCASCCAPTPSSCATTSRSTTSTPVSSFLGKLGNPAQGGLLLTEFKRRQELHRIGEIHAMRDVPEFIRKAHEIYGYSHFVNDAGGSLCELDERDVLQVLDDHTLILYIKATDHDEEELIRRAEEDPKPLYYRSEFLDEQLAAVQGRVPRRVRRADRPGRLRPLDVPAPVPCAHPALRGHRAPARLHHHHRRAERGPGRGGVPRPGRARPGPRGLSLRPYPGDNADAPRRPFRAARPSTACSRRAETVTPLERAIHQDIRELHIGLLNMMPDAALEATERQFFRLVGREQPDRAVLHAPLHASTRCRAAPRARAHRAPLRALRRTSRRTGSTP